MNCSEVRPLLNAYLDDELDLPTVLQIEAHLSTCDSCRKQLAGLRAVAGAASRGESYHPASAKLRERIQSAIRTESRADKPNPIRQTRTISLWKHPVTYSGIAAALLLFIGLLFRPGAGPLPVAEILDSHVRSLEANHLLDVESTDQHTVKPWFAGKIDFAPPVIDLAPDGFPLVGGRLDYLEQRKVAAVIYRHDKHIINLFIWPGETSDQTSTAQGYNFIRFECKGMTCWAVSDLNMEELHKFTALFQAQKSPSTRN